MANKVYQNMQSVVSLLPNDLLYMRDTSVATRFIGWSRETRRGEKSNASVAALKVERRVIIVSYLPRSLTNLDSNPHTNLVDHSQ